MGGVTEFLDVFAMFAVRYPAGPGGSGLQGRKRSAVDDPELKDGARSPARSMTQLRLGVHGQVLAAKRRGLDKPSWV